MEGITITLDISDSLRAAINRIVEATDDENERLWNGHLCPGSEVQKAFGINFHEIIKNCSSLADLAKIDKVHRGKIDINITYNTPSDHESS